MISDLNYDNIKFPASRKEMIEIGSIEKKKNICINVFGYENGLVYPVHIR